MKSIAVLICVFACFPLLAQEGEPMSFAQEEEQLFYEDRAEIPLALTWNLDDLFVDDAAAEAAAEAIEARLGELSAFAGRLGEGPQVLADALVVQFELDQAASEVIVYANQQHHLDTRNQDSGALVARAGSMAARLGETAAFMRPEISGLEDLDEWKEHAALKPFDHFLGEIQRFREHTRSGEVEQVLAESAQLQGGPSGTYSALHNADLPWPTIDGPDGEPVNIVPGQYGGLLRHPDREWRKKGTLALLGAYDDFGNVFAATYGAQLQRDVWVSKTRGYDTVLEMALDGPGVPREVVDRLVETVHANTGALHRYAALKKRVLGLDELHVYDLYLPIVEGGDTVYTFDQGWALAMEFWSETFGQDYADVAARGLAERWVDVYTNSGKRPGAYSWGTYGSHPYLLLNWAGGIDDVSTLVHEMGHSVHTYLAAQAQPYHYSDYPLFVAEVASVASESLFLEWMASRVETDKDRLVLLNLSIDKISGTFFRQIFFHDFEAEAHRMAEAGEPITKASLAEVYGGLWTTYFGPELVVDPVYTAGWARVNHFYRTFYVWVYATSYAAGDAIAARFRSGDEEAVDDYLAALALGSSASAMDTVRRAGVDMSAEGVFQSVMDRFEKLVAELEVALEPQD